MLAWNWHWIEGSNVEFTSFYPILGYKAGDIAQLARAAALQAVGGGVESHYIHKLGVSSMWNALMRCSLKY